MNRLLGWLLIWPALALGIWQLVVPAGQTVWTSVRLTRAEQGVPGWHFGLKAYVEGGLARTVLV